MSQSLTEEKVLLQQWLNGIRMSQIGHLRAAAYYKLRSRGLGLVVVIASVIVSTSAFSSLTSSNNQAILIVVGVTGAIATVLSSVQAFLNYSELANSHQSAGVLYGKLRRRLEEALFLTNDIDELKKLMEKTRREWDELDEKSPALSQRFIDEALKRIRPSLTIERNAKEE